LSSSPPRGGPEISILDGDLTTSWEPLAALSRRRVERGRAGGARDRPAHRRRHGQHLVAGGVLSYGQNFAEIYRQNGLYTVKILKGATPADLPVQQVDKFELTINLKAAKAQGIAISDNLLSLADEVIE
jgi:ABC transporter substrate binding protein